MAIRQFIVTHMAHICDLNYASIISSGIMCPEKDSLIDTRFFFFKHLFIWLHWVLVVARGIQFPDQGLNLGPLYWESGVLATGHQRSPKIPDL